MRILGIDPGIGRTGWGVVESTSMKYASRHFGCIETQANTPTPGRLLTLYDELCDIIKEYKPEAMAIEELFFNKNVTTALTVGQARGVIMLSAVQHNLPIAIYTPLEVKVAVTGYGRAEKSQVAHMVKTILHLEKIPKPDDTTDALAIALTHAFSAKMREKV